MVSLVEDGTLQLTTTARSVLGKDIPLLGNGVTVEHLLAHRSGIGDYLDEEAGLDLDEYLMPVPVHELATTEDYLAVLDGHPPKFAPGERFAYCNSGYVVLALIAERATGTPFHELVQCRVCERAGMHDTAFLRSDELPARTARGYLEGNDTWRTNVFHLPVRGSGDGGIYSTAADIRSLWTAFFDGRIVSHDWVAEMVRPRSDVSSQSRRYGLGFWLHASADAVLLTGMDAGVSFSSMHEPQSNVTRTVISNTLTELGRSRATSTTDSCSDAVRPTSLKAVASSSGMFPHIRSSNIAARSRTPVVLEGEQFPVPFGDDFNCTIGHFDGALIIDCVRRHGYSGGPSFCVGQGISAGISRDPGAGTTKIDQSQRSGVADGQILAGGSRQNQSS